MNKIGIAHIGSLAAAGLALGLVLHPAVAWGQATDVVCSGCIQATDIENGTIGPNKLIPGSINAATIANGSIGPNKLIPGSINRFTIANDAIRSNKILDGAVKSADIGDGEVTSLDIATGGVTGIEILDGAVSSADIADGSVTGVDVADGTLTGTDIADGTVTGGDISDGSITSADITDGSITSSDIVAGGISGTEILNGSLTAEDLGDEAGVEFASSDQNSVFSGTDATIQSVTLTVPTNGFVLAQSTGNWLSNGTAIAVCSITTGTIVETSHEFAAGGNSIWIPLVGSRVLAVSAGSVTINLVCSVNGAGAGQLFDTGLNALFVPTRY